MSLFTVGEAFVVLLVARQAVSADLYGYGYAAAATLVLLALTVPVVWLQWRPVRRLRARV
jgi:ABC-type sugar transport system permease subunit